VIRVPTDVIFRSATEADLPAIVALLADDAIGAGREDLSSSDAYTTAFREVSADPRNHLVVADVGGEVAGTLQLTYIPGVSRMGTERAQIEGVRVAAAHRSRGLGREMIRWAVGQAEARGCRLVQLTSDKRRSDAIRFYESLGFEPTHVGMKLPLHPVV
jgi:ribosomal protein S18 acetylase RimI-like enzyme